MKNASQRVRTGGERTGHAVQESVFISEHRSGTNDRGVGECFLDGNFALGFGPVELRGRVQRGVQMRDMDEFRNPALLRDVGDGLGTSDMDRVKIEVPEGFRLSFVTQGVGSQVLCLVIPPDKVVHDVRMSKALRGLFFVPQVPFLRNPKRWAHDD